MNITEILAQADQHGDFYMYYPKKDSKGTTYLVGTLDFANKYIQSKVTSDRVTRGTDPDALQADLQKRNSILVFSWTNDRFRILPATSVKKMTALRAEIQSAGKR
ncbi:hypothetical protein [Vibrio phage JSF12]|uniref:Uncharacterized protein n=2 Tax=Jesfedecavirus TaxID=2560156 RepID=A0A2D0YXC5_9CAUD|nr:hypothetical protein FDI98_gp098 [Vibrio phage JSF10]YP_009794830.1 hypothetical protein HOS35_gp147 [Vibrio phage JSF12]ASV43434.1 hypothetical protein [Vibrio phage JSF10]ASV43665.1 hypothetical protein [Vibrio phage JSF12]